VTFIDADSGEILLSRTADRRTYGLSAQAMEPFLTKQMLAILKDNGINILSVAHDDNKGVTAHVENHVNPDGSHPVDQLDNWHYVKLLLKVVICSSVASEVHGERLHRAGTKSGC